MTRLLVPTVTLTLVYALTLASFDPWDLLLGALLSGGLLLGFRRFLASGPAIASPGPLARVLAFVPFAGAVLRDVVVGTWNVVLVVLHLRPLNRPGIVEIPLDGRTPTGVAVMALVTTLSPGSFLVDVDWGARTMLLHVLDASDPDRVRADQLAAYRSRQRRVFP